MAEIVRQGGLVVAIVARYSFLPPHYCTAVFATIGMPFWVFTISAILSLPRQFVTVFVGVVLEDKAQGKETTADKIATYATLAVSIVVTYGAFRYLKVLTGRVKPKVIYARRKARQAKLAQFAGDDTTQSFSESQSNLLQASESNSSAYYPPQAPQYAVQAPAPSRAYPPEYQDSRSIA